MVHEVKSDLEALGLAGVVPGAVVTCVGGGGLLAGILQGLGRVVQSRSFIWSIRPFVGLLVGPLVHSFCPITFVHTLDWRASLWYTRAIHVVHT